MSIKTKRQAKALKEMSVAIQKRNTKIMYLQEENLQLREMLDDYTCALLAMDGYVKLQPYGGYKDPSVIAILKKNGIVFVE